MVDASDANGRRVGVDAVNGTASAYFHPASKVGAKGLQQSEGLELLSPWLVQGSALQKAERKVEMSKPLGKAQASESHSALRISK